MTISTVMGEKKHCCSSSLLAVVNCFKQNTVCCILGMFDEDHEGNVLKTTIKRSSLNLSVSGKERCKSE